MLDLLRTNWLWELLAFLLGGAITWTLLERRPAEPAAAGDPATRAADSADRGKAPAERVEDDVNRAEATANRTQEPADQAQETTSRAEESASRAERPANRAEEPANRAEEPARGEELSTQKVLVAVGAPEPAPAPATTAPAVVSSGPGAVPAGRPRFSRLMANPDPEALDDGLAPPPVDTADDVPPGPYGPGSAPAVPHQGPPDGFTIKAATGSMLFHTPDSPAYGRTRPDVWFRTESAARAAGFTPATHHPRRSPAASSLPLPTPTIRAHSVTPAHSQLHPQEAQCTARFMSRSPSSRTRTACGPRRQH